VNSLRQILRSPPVASLLASVLVFLGVFLLWRTGNLEFLELVAYDASIRFQPKVSARDSRVVLIGITERDIGQQRHWPISDATLARALQILTQYQPRAIGLDLFRDVSVPPGHEELRAILSGNRHIVAAMKFGNDVEIGIAPPPVLNPTDQVGFNDILVDPGGIVRRGLLFLDDGHTVAASFALQLALLYLQAEGITAQPDAVNAHHVRLGDTTMRPLEANDGGYVGADARGYQFLLDYRDAAAAFPLYSLTTLLAEGIDAKVIHDNIVLIGTTAESVKDFFYTPHSHGLQNHQHMPGIVLHAHMVSQLLRFGLDHDAPMTTVSDGYEGLWLLLWSILGGLLGLWMRSAWRFSLMVTCGLCLLVLIAYSAFVARWWIPVIPPAMAWVLSAAVVTAYISRQEEEQRTFLMQLFSKHVSQEVAETIWQQREQFLDGGRPRPQGLTVTVLFADLEGFTTVSEKMAPQALIDWLNTYLETMAQLVMEHGGVIDDYAGDGLKADFGVPVARTTETEIRGDAERAVTCALAMMREMQRLNQRWQQQSLPTARMRVGIFTGPVVAGSLGSARRLKYTTIGDTVNVASRLSAKIEGLNERKSIDPDIPDNHCCILAGETTVHYLDQCFQTQRVGEVSLKGKEHTITAYRVIGRNDSQIPALTPEECV
jgi:adenylate cyclase